MPFMQQVPGLDVNEVQDGYVVYQPEQDRVHYLNPTASVIFEFCDGLQSDNEIIASVATAFELPAERHAEIRACLSNLQAEGLIAPKA